MASTEVISADQGTATVEAAPVHGAHGGGYSAHGGYGAHGGYSSHGMITREEYGSAAYSSSGAGPYTTMIMLFTVSLGYAFLFAMLYMSCCVQRMRYAGFQQFDVEQETTIQKQTVVSELEPMWRKAFISKVYSLLVVQILVTLVVSVLMMQLGGYDFYVWSLTAGAWTRIASLLATIGTLVGLFCYKNRYPLNLVLLFAFTLAMSYTIGIVTTMYAAAGMQVIVVEAFAITSLLFVALTIFTIVSKIDFSFLGYILPVLLFTLIIWGFFARFAFHSFAFSQVYAVGGVVIFSLFVLYDTHAITTYLCYDDYVLGAINLYLDFINLFLFVLQLLTGMRRD